MSDTCVIALMVAGVAFLGLRPGRYLYAGKDVKVVERYPETVMEAD